MIVTLFSCRPGTLEATSWAIPRTELAVERARPRQQHRGRGGVLVFAEDLVLGARQHELDLRAGDALDAVDRFLELALQRALVGDLLLEVAFAEVLFFEQREARLGVAEQVRARQRHARLGGLVGLHGDRGAVVLQLVVDPLGG